MTGVQTWCSSDLDDEIIFTVHRSVPQLFGDGVLTISELIAKHNQKLIGSGVSGISHNPVYVDSEGTSYAPTDILPEKATVPLRGRSNFSAGGAGEIVRASSVPPLICDTAKAAAKALGLRVAGVDLFYSERLGVNQPEVHVIEVNGNPSMKLLETQGRFDLIELIWHSIFRKIGLGADV